MATLSSVAELIMGQSPPSSTYNDKGEGLPFYQGKTDFGFKYPVPRLYCSSPRKIAEVGDILISVRAPVGPTNIVAEKSCIGRGLGAIRAQGLDSDFLYFNLKYIEPYIASLGTGSTFTAINKDQLANLEVNQLGFEFSEQRRIAYVLSTVQTAIEQQERLIKITRELKSALMHKLFTEGLRGEKQKMTEIGPVPESWDVVKISQAYTFTEKRREANLSQPIPFIPMELIPVGENEIVNYETREKVTSGTYVENGDLLIAKITPSFENGKQGILKIPFEKAFATTEVIPIKPIQGKSDLLYLHYYLFMPNVRSTMAGKMEGTTGRQRLSKTIVGEQLIPLPKILEQKEISQMLSRFDDKILVTKRKKTILEELFRTLLHQLMTGQTRVNDIDLPGFK